MKALTIPIRLIFTDEGYIDRKEVEANVAAVIRAWVSHGRIIPDEKHATLTDWSVGVGDRS